MQTPYRKPGKYSQMKQDPMITQDKFDELTRKLDRLKKSRPAAAAEVSRLAELGDFSENVEYQLAKGKLRGINNSIQKLEQQLNHAEIITRNIQSGIVGLGHIVHVICGNETKIYQILGSSETNPQRGVISHSSPIGLALLGHKVGDIVSVKLVNKEVEYKIVKIE